MATVYTFFHGTFSGLEITCLQSFLDHGHELTVFAYEDTDVPSIFRRVNAATILPRERVYYYRSEPGKGSIAGFANLFRYTALERHDGWWVDTDVLCQTGRWPRSECVAAWEAEDRIGNAVLKLPPHIARLCRAECEALGDDFPWGVAGPRLVTRVFQAEGLLSHVLPPGAFYPIPYERWYEFMDPQNLSATQQACEGSFGVHLWHEMMRRAGLDKRRLPPQQSFVGAAVAAHATEAHFER